MIHKTSEQNLEKYTLWVNDVLIIIMMVCASISVVQLMQRIFVGWEGGYVVVLVLFVSAERLLTFTRTQSFDFEQKVVYHLAEFIIFAILLKLLGYIQHGFNTFVEDAINWQRDFSTFFEPEYIFVLILTLITWMVSGKFAEYIEEMRIDPLDMKWDVGILENRRQSARLAIINLIIWISTGMIFTAILTRLDLVAVFGQNPALHYPVVNILFYFLAAFLLFSLTQYTLLRGRWIWHSAERSVGMERSWLKAGLLFLLIIAVLSFFLPTSYTVDFLNLLRIFLNVLTQIIFFIFSLLFLPIGWLFSLLKGSPVAEEPPQTPDFSALTQSVSNQPMPPFILFLQSLLFWVIFIGVILLSFSIYLRQNNIQLPVIQVNFFETLKSWFASFLKWFRHQQKSISLSIQQFQQRARIRLPAQRKETQKTRPNVDLFSPQQEVIHGFIRLTLTVKQHGVERKPNQTAGQFSQALQTTLPDSSADIQEITHTFEMARYSQFPITRSISSLFKSSCRRIVAALENIKTPPN